MPSKASKDKLDKMELRQSYQNFWHTDLMNTMTADPPYCFFSCFCGQCASYLLRKRALYNDMSRYECCAGYMPCSGKCGEKKCPEFCLCTEVFCCFANSVASTRFLLQDDFNIHTTKCDNCIIAFMFCLNQLACIFSLIAIIVGSDEINEASQLLNCLSDMVYLTVCACMQTQHKLELDKRDGVLTSGAMVPPPVQQMSRVDQPYPPTAGSPTHKSPDHQPPPPPPYGYAPQGYPDHATPPQGYPGYPNQPPQGYPNQPPQGYPNQPPQGYPNQPPQGYPNAGAYPPPGYPPQAYPPSGYPHPGYQK